MSQRAKPKPASNYQDFIGSHWVGKDDPRQPTNTRITGGKYYIPDDEYPDFLNHYYKDIVSKNGDEFLTEKQRETGGPIAVDFDFRYAYEVTEKQYEDKHIASIIQLYLEVLKGIFQFADKCPFPLYVFEKPSVNRLEDKQITKDGIHMIIGIQTDRTTQTIIRQRVMEKIEEEWGDLPLKNTWEDVLDKGISTGVTNWQLYGSKKPDHDKYALTRVYEYEYDTTDGEFMEVKVPVKKFNWAADFAKLSVRYTGHPQFFFKAEFIAVHEKNKTSDAKRPAFRAQHAAAAQQVNFSVSSIKTKADIDALVTQLLESLKPDEYNLREAYELAMILPVEYYGEGSYLKWMKVGWALSNISKKLFIAWVAFSAKSPTFQFDSIPDLYEKWTNFDTNNNQGLTKRSIIYWAREASPTEFRRINEASIGYYMDQSIKYLTLNGMSKGDQHIGCGDTDIAKILYMMYKDNYACAGLKADKWYRFAKHRWVEDECGTSLRRHISDELKELYRIKCEEFTNKLHDPSQTDDKMKVYEGLSNKILEIIGKLSQTTHKDHILKEAREQFFDPEVSFMDLLDSNPYLLSCKNGVIDIKNKVFRPGRAEDYLSKCTNINYTKLDRTRDAKTIAEIEDFFEKLFPNKALRQYMWQHLASILVGVNLNQKLHLYIGNGENGKSVLMDLMSQCLGDYYAISPISLITQSRQKQGQASPDIVALKGVRLACMQEPSKDDKINDGAMKELTSGVEPIKGRNLFSTPITFVPQCKIVVCSNNFMKVETRDHGTWRRLAVVDFESLFTENPVTDDPDKPYQYKVDRTIKEKFGEWREVLLAMLVDILFDTQGRVDACKIIDDSSLKYKEGQDHIAEFIRDKVVADANGRITKTEATNEFNIWYTSTYGRGGSPNTKEVHEYFDKRFGRYKVNSGGWLGVKIRYERDDMTVVSSNSDDSDISAEDL
jgi:P4 family phage/plasmid primase-like protien